MANLFKVNTGNLEIGMYISELDRPWLETPFLVQGFYVKNRNDIDIISNICDYVFVDTAVTRQKITSKMPTVSSAIGIDPGRTEFTVTNINTDVNKSRPKDIATDSTWDKSNLDALFPDKELAEYADTTNWQDETPAAREAISTLHICLNDLLTRNEKGSPLEIVKIKQAVEPMVDSVTRNPDACIWLARMKQEDNYIYEHSLGASIWAVTLGRQLGLPKSDLNSLAIGGLLFDVGKLRLSNDLLKAKRHLTSKETKIMKRHVEIGVKLLEEGGMMNQDVIDMTAHHHERHNGNGYPKGLVGDQIPVFARIAAIVDCYDAITSDRIYARAIAPSLAIKQLYEWKDNYFQAELIEEFIQAIGIYPAGTLVELSSGEVAIVVAESRSRRLRPQVMLLLDSDKQPLDDFQYIDLLEDTQTDKGLPLDIVNSLKPNAYGIDMSGIEL
jgi:HD-GYP domain-containing protein (c-di-GMP phosphodiesterase class II)